MQAISTTEHAFALRQAHERGQKTHPQVLLPFAAFADGAVTMASNRLAQTGVDPTPSAIANVLSMMPAEDVYLACACEAGVPGAWARFTSHFVPLLRRIAEREGATAAEAEVLAIDLCSDLSLARTDGRSRTRLGAYEGSGTLLGWLAVSLMRRMANRPDRSRLVPLRTTPESADHQASAPDPADTVIDVETGTHLVDGLQSAWSLLSRKQSLAVLYRFQGGLGLEEIGRLLGVGKPRASRILKKAVERMRHRLEPVLKEVVAHVQYHSDHSWRAATDAVASWLEATASGATPRFGDDHADGSAQDAR